MTAREDSINTEIPEIEEITGNNGEESVEGISRIHETWGRSRRSKRVHYFVKGVSLCGRVRNPDFIAEDWDERDRFTCQVCREWKRWYEKGLTSVREYSPVEHVPD